MTRSLVSFFRRIFIFLLAVAAVPAFAQNSFTVKFRLLDAGSGEPVGYATASLTVKGEKSASKYVLTDGEGNASLAKVRKGTYILKAELMGYKTYEKELLVEKNVNLGDIKMEEDVKVLDAASVSAVGNPIIVKKDTIEYTASSFKTSDNDMLEDLLKKLPGVEVASDGSITANGETIKKITIDGKTFFLDDPQLASKNLPAKMIEKVKVVEKKSDQAIFTGIDDGNEETIIDLSVYKGMMNGWFGNLSAGGGHDVPDPGYYNDEHTFLKEGWRYQGAGMIGNFKEDSQISIILNANNTNNRGFYDMAGSMMQGMRGGGGGMGRGMGGFGGGNGETTSWMGGLNGSFDLFDGAMELAGNYLYNGSERVVEEESSKVTYMENGSRLLNDNSGYSTTGSQGHRFGIRMDHEFSKNTSLLFEPQVNFGSGSFSEYSDFSTKTAMGADTTFTNRGFTNSFGDNRNWSTSGRLLFRQRLGKAGRTLSLNMNYSFSNNDMDSWNQSNTQTDVNADGLYENDIVDQFYKQNSRSSSVSGRLVYTEPLTQYLFLEGSYQYSWSSSKSIKDAFNGIDSRDEGNVITQDGYDMANPDPTYSSSILNRNINHQAGVTISWQKDNINAQIGMRALPQNTFNETNGETYRNDVVNWSPTARIRYRFSDYTNMMFNYNGRSSQPSTSQLMPVPDNTNPLNISLGNPYLKPYFNHSARLNFGYTNRQSFTSVHTDFSGGMVQEAITNAQWYDKSGVQYSIPVNGPGTGNVSGRVMVNSPIGKSDFSIMSMTNARYNQSTSYIGTGSLDSDKYYDAGKAEFNYELFNADFPDLGNTDAFTVNKIRSMNLSQMLRLTYRNDFVELVAGGRTNLSKSWYTLESANQNATWNNNVSFEMNWTLPFGMNLIGDLNYNWYNGYTTQQEPEFIINAEITQLLFKKTCTLALRAYDILNQAKNLSVTDASNYHQEVRNNTLGRYVVLSFTYRFGTFGGNRGNRGPAGRPGSGGGRPAMGPPMGMRR
ncbi:MAG: outer membrane beta-barrel protein [Bacteroidales bacterium]|nr:outer membrane beta-barrel protein [Bacteroidales bacterium]